MSVSIAPYKFRELYDATWRQHLKTNQVSWWSKRPSAFTSNGNENYWKAFISPVTNQGIFPGQSFELLVHLLVEVLSEEVGPEPIERVHFL